MKIALITSLLFFSSTVFAETCLHSIKAGSEKLTWTGYKYTKKAAVSGTFDKIIFTQKDGGTESMADLINSIEFVIDTHQQTQEMLQETQLLKKLFLVILKHLTLFLVNLRMLHN